VRTLFYLICLAALIVFGSWTYKVNYATRDVQRRVAQLKNDIEAEAEAIEVLRAEWAYLNRPERLLSLSEANFEILGLGPVMAEHFAKPRDVMMPVEELPGVIVVTTTVAAEN